VGTQEGQPGIGGSVLSSEQIWTFDRKSLEQAVDVVPGVVSTFDANGRRNESDIFVRGFGRWQVPLTVDGVRAASGVRTTITHTDWAPNSTQRR
jgi:iron complex outermembrane receptor protein